VKVQALCAKFGWTCVPVQLRGDVLTILPVSGPICRAVVNRTRDEIKHRRPGPSVGANSLFKLDNRNRTRLVQKPNWTRLEGQKGKCVLQYTDFLIFSRLIKHKVRVPEYTFILLPLQSRLIWILYQSRPVSIVQLK
jgi:hypothetical protein